MLNTKEILDRIVAGKIVPFSMFVAAKPAHFKMTGKAEGLISYRCERNGLEAELGYSHNPDFGHLVFSVRISAAGSVPGRIDKVKILDLTIDHPDIEVETVFRRFTGGSAKGHSHETYPTHMFKCLDVYLDKHDIFKMGDDSGRGSNEFLPVWLYGNGADNLWFAPEWQGAWEMEIRRIPEFTYTAVCLQNLDFVMRPGEIIQLPPMALGSSPGSLDNACNAVRKVLRELYLPRISGNIPEPLSAYQVLGDHPNYLAGKSLFREADIASRLGAETFTFSSFWQFDLKKEDSEGWKWWEIMGSYTPSAERFPGGIRKFATHLKDKGMRLGLWIDPRIGFKCPELDRARDLLLFHDEDFECEIRKYYNDLSYEINVPPLINLTISEGREYLGSILDRMVEEYGAGFIWYDLNSDPHLCHCLCNDDPDRKGLLELEYFRGMNMVLSEFNKRHPEVIVEMCASGGRMINLAVLRYSHSLWITDYTGPDPDIAAGIRRGANMALPAALNHQSFYMPEKDDSDPLREHFCLAHFNGAYGISQGLIHYAEHDLEVMEKMNAIFKSVRHYLSGDYYYLPQSPDRHGWDGWQYHDPETGSGILMLMRLSRCSETEKEVTLDGLGDRTITGAEILSGDAQVSMSGRKMKFSFADEQAVLVEYRT